jgi:hypothetical protein
VSWCRGARGVCFGGRRGVGTRPDGDRSWPGRPPWVKLVAVGDAHEVVVPRGLKVQASELDFESAGRGSELPMEYLWPLCSVRITIEMACGS